MFKTFKWNYSALKPCDLFYSNGIGLVGGCIRLGETGKISSMFDRTIPNHVGIITEDHGQLFGTEVQSHGIENNSLEKYTSNLNQIIEIWRHPWFDNAATSFNAQAYLAMWRRRRQEKGYDIIGAVRSSPWIRRLFPWLRNDPRKEYCSEDVASFLRYQKFVQPMEWIKNPPNPLALRDWNAQHDWVKVNGWRLKVR